MLLAVLLIISGEKVAVCLMFELVYVWEYNPVVSSPRGPFNHQAETLNPFFFQEPQVEELLSKLYMCP